MFILEIILLSVIAIELGIIIYLISKDPKTIVVETDSGITQAETSKRVFKEGVPYKKNGGVSPMVFK